MKKLYTLDVLINQTEPNELPDSHLFSMHTIENQKNIMMIEEGRCSTRDIKEIMEKSNIIWGMRNRIKNGESYDTQPLQQLEMELHEFIQKGQKINAIKHYRSVMNRQYGIEISLKWDLSLILNIFNINLAKEASKKFWKMGINHMR